MPSRTTPGRQRRFLEEYAKCGVITEAARQANIDQDCHWKWMADPEYKAAFEYAKRIAGDSLETELFRRIREGIEEPVIFQGEQQWERDSKGKLTGRPLTVRKYESAYLIFALKGAKPDKYRDTWKGELTHTGALAVSRGPDLTKLSNEQLDLAEQLALTAAADIASGAGPGGDPDGEGETGAEQDTDVFS